MMKGKMVNHTLELSQFTLCLRFDLLRGVLARLSSQNSDEKGNGKVGPVSFSIIKIMGRPWDGKVALRWVMKK